MDLSRPHFIFAATWITALLLAVSVETNMTVYFPPEIYWLVLGSIAAFFVSAGLVRILFPIKPGTPRFPTPTNLDLDILSLFIWRVFLLWILGFVGTIIYSDGIPAYWRFVGDPRTYIDFGMPSVSGLLNMLRCFCCAAVVALFVLKRARKRDYVVGAVMLASAVAEISRGSIVSTVLHGVAMIMLFRPIRFGQMLKWLVGVWAGLALFDWVGNVRNMGERVDYAQTLGGVFASSDFFGSFVWSFIYIAIPINNLAYAVSQNFIPTMEPYYTLSSLVPTFIRSFVFKPGDYPIELFNETFNATTFYSPLVADFGVWVALGIFSIITLIIAFAYNSAKRGSLFGILVYPPIFTSVTLSFFYSYFFALPIVLYPIVALAYLRFRRNILVRHGLK